MEAAASEEKKIIVCGYPKSGNTWASRLIAETLNCPVKGFFGAENQREIAKEGKHRESEYALYKAHQRHRVLKEMKPYHSVIYIVRDVRDVTVSGAHYFDKSKHDAWRDERGLPHLDKFEAMTQTVIKGGVYGHCRRPWGQHVRGYLDNGAFYIRYEDLLSKPEEVLTRIHEHVGIPVDKERMAHAIQNQSFDVAKARYEEKGDKRKANFLRKGASGGYADELTPDQIERLETAYSPLLERLGYAV